jgi:hypothetical protein
MIECLRAGKDLVTNRLLFSLFQLFRSRGAGANSYGAKQQTEGPRQNSSAAFKRREPLCSQRSSRTAATMFGSCIRG